jgi:hypothetical protein
MSIIYNVTVKVEANIAESWLQWMIEEHIPEILATKCFQEYRILRLLEVDETEGPTYAIQYMAESRADYNRYIEIYAEGMRKKTYDRWGERFIAFRSVMAVVK